MTGMIAETEAYTADDAASHSFGNRITKRNRAMFLDAGHLYIYFIYGMHYCINIVAEQQGVGCAVLLRSLIPLRGIEIMRQNYTHAGGSHNAPHPLTNGPAKLCKAFAIDPRYNALNLADKKSDIYLLKDASASFSIEKTTRIGIRKASDKLWRFLLKD